MTEAERAIVRNAYAKQIVHAAGTDDPRLEEALATIRREDFLPPPPWQIMHLASGSSAGPVADAVYLYQDAPVAILAEKRLNNGQPSFLTRLIAAGNFEAGAHAVHIGTGTGYYTAVIGRLVGPTGRVTGIEIEPGLAAQAASNLARFPHVRVVSGDGTALPLDPADVVFVNAGAARPADAWLDALKPEGRLILPLTLGFTTEQGQAMTRGAVFRITRQADGYAARCLSRTVIYPCAGSRDRDAEAALAAAFAKDGIGRVTRLHRTDDLPEDRCWLRAPGWSLAYD
ncbi:protein-L-isoaspartate O-methyltransferase family protein [Methylobacterium trifolii]|uniref:Protein-L-isoaspartate O-methyltransferase n=1 Tax=Methylobacterium trifolii TaxID=1003092 RepID=A0ABQ4TY86_9HYPH|nr:methyltransferase domain-containing protein [Methylobacterium trifolii]GJE58958.1 Protein-L-isoaspartate O-methyltransferase [Methylobacterium trifolii]